MGVHKKYFELVKKQEELLSRKNVVDEGFYNGIYDRYVYPVLTREHAPILWQYDLSEETNPYFEERLGINAVMNSGAIELNGKYYLVARVEGNDRKSFFAVAESESPVDGFRFWDEPILLPDTCPEETNVYDMRLTKHEDGYIYGVFCSESKDTSNSDLSAAVAAAGIVRTKDLKSWERLPNLKTLRSPQQRNVVLHPEFVNGKYAFYTRPMDDFIDTGSGGGIGFGLCDDITNAVIDEEIITSKRKYHTITEVKNGAGAVPIKTEKGWIHIAHGVRNTAAGLRYVIYVFATALDDPARVIAEPSGLLIGPRGQERVGDVSNVVFTNGAIAKEDGTVYIYYASSDTRLHVARTSIDRLVDYVFNTPEDPLRSVECVAQRCELIRRNLELLKESSHEPIILEPVLKENVWGGSRLVTEFHYREEGSGLGECWGISAHPHGDCKVAEGTYKGMTLSELYQSHRELFGGLKGEEFPLLVKIIDAKEKLSIQVHPNDAYAKLHENGSLGKTECWYVMDCPENAELVIGHNAKTREELADMVHAGRYEELIRRVPVKKGDFIQIVPGTIHAITAGMLILETQQSSDVTYRVYDYGRLVDGKPRQIHVEQSIEVTNVPDESDKKGILHAQKLSPNLMNELVNCEYYRVWKLNVNGQAKVEQKYPFLLVSVTEGTGEMNGRALKRGDHLILPFGFGEAEFTGDMEIILSTAVEN